MRIALLALAFLCMPTFAFAQTLALDAVRTACVAHNADPGAIAADLASRGWRQIGEAERRQRDPDNIAQGFIMHWSSSQAWAPADDATVTLVLGEGTVGEGVSARYCAAVERRSFSQQVRAVRRWLGFERFQTWGPGGDTFAYLRNAEGALTNAASISDADRDAAVRDGRYGFVQVVGDGSTSMVNFSALHHTAPEGEQHQ